MMSAEQDDDFADIGAKRVITPEDIIRIAGVGSAVASHDGQHIAFVRSRFDERTQRKAAAIYLVPTAAPSDGSARAVRQLTAGPSDASPCWAPDSRHVAFVRASHAFVVSLHGGEPYALTNFAVPLANLDWSPRANVLSFTAHVYLDDDSFQATKERDDQAQDWKVYDDLMTREWDRWMTEKRSHLFVVPIAYSVLPGDDVYRWRLTAPPRDVMTGVDADTPPNQTFGGREHISWSPCGKRIAYTCKPRSIDAAWSVNTVIHLASIGPIGDDQDESTVDEDDFIVLQTSESEAMDTCPLFSPDGKYLSFLSSKRPGHEADRLELIVHEIGTRSLRRMPFTPQLDVSIAEYVWLNNDVIAFTADHLAQRKVFTVNVDGKSAPNTILSVGSHSGLCVSNTSDNKTSHLLFTFSTLCSPPELAGVTFEQLFNSTETEVKEELWTKANVTMCEALDLPEPKSLNIVGAQGKQMQCWMIAPPRAYVAEQYKNVPKDDVKFPVMLLAHGGPQGCWDNSWHSRWNIQTWAAKGFVCVIPNFTGSTGFGQAYTDVISKNWDVAAKDCLLALDFCIEEFSFIDPAQQFAMGASFGGWLMMFFNGQCEDRFKCLVAHDGIFDLTSMYYETDELWFPEWELGTPTADAVRYRRLSPSTFVSKWQTPILFLHGGKDFRCPLGQSISGHAAARRRGIRSRLAVSDEASHWVTDPRAALGWHKIISEFLQEFTQQ